MPDDLFAAAAEDRLVRQAPLAARLRPTSLDDVVGQEHLLGPGRPLRALIEADRLSSVILWGPPGPGKTTIAQLMARTTAKAFEQLSAVTATVKDVREAAARAEERHNQSLRRLVYGGNLALTTLLLFVALVILNVVFSAKVPAMLDTTESGFYTLSDATKATVARLPEPVTAYVILPDSGDREINDVRQLMFSAQEASGGRW